MTRTKPRRLRDVAEAEAKKALARKKEEKEGKIWNIVYIGGTAVTIILMLAIFIMTSFTEVDGKLAPNTPIPTWTPSVMTITGRVVQQPTRHGYGSGMDTRLTLEMVDYSPVSLIGEDVIVLLDASAAQLKKGDVIMLNNCQMDMTLPLKLINCDYKQIIGE